MNKFVKNVALYVFIIVIAVAIFNTFVHPQEKFTEMAYSDFVAQIEKKNVSSVIMVENSIKGKLKDGTEFSTYIPNNDTQIVKKMTDGDVVITVKPPEQPSWWMSLLSSLLPILILVGVWFWIMNQTQGGGGRVMSFGRSRARMSGEGQVHVNFSDVAGEDEAKEELAEVVDFLKNPGRYTAIGAKIPKGVLLVGPPGTGKTLLAKAVAGEAKVPFFSISGSDFVEMFVGVGASRVRDLFAQAKKNAPCIVFIDEIDAVGRQRGSGLGGGHDEREQTLNQLLTEMDGFEGNNGVIILAATNRPESLDPALLRPGRFDRRVPVELPDLKGREEILKVHARKIKVADNVDFNKIARMASGASGAELANIVNEAALRAMGLEAIATPRSGNGSGSGFGGFGNTGFDPRPKATLKPRVTAKADKPYISKGINGLNQLAVLQKGTEFKAPDALDYTVGDRVRHIKYGEGTVLNIAREPRDYKVTVEFDQAGQKIMYASFAKLKRV